MNTTLFFVDHKSMTFKDQKRALTVLIRYKIKNIVFIGTSPTLPDLISYALKRKCTIGVMTKGYFIQKNHMPLLKKCAFVQIGDKEKIKMLLRHRVPVYTHVTKKRFKWLDHYLMSIHPDGKVTLNSSFNMATGHILNTSFRKILHQTVQKKAIPIVQ